MLLPNAPKCKTWKLVLDSWTVVTYLNFFSEDSNGYLYLRGPYGTYNPVDWPNPTRSHCQGEESPLHAVAQNNAGSDLPAYHYDSYNYGMHMIFLA